MGEQLDKLEQQASKYALENGLATYVLQGPFSDPYLRSNFRPSILRSQLMCLFYGYNTANSIPFTAEPSNPARRRRKSRTRRAPLVSSSNRFSRPLKVPTAHVEMK